MIFRKSEIEALCEYPRPEFRRETALLNTGWFRFSFSRYSDMNGFLDRFFEGESFTDGGLPTETEMPFVMPSEEAAPVTVFVKRFSIKPVLEKDGCAVLRLCCGNWYGDARFFVNGSHVADTAEPYEPVAIELNTEAIHSGVLSVAVCVEPRADIPFVGSGQPFWMEFCGAVFLNGFLHRYENGVSQFRLSFSAPPSDFRLKIPEIGWEADSATAEKEEATEFVLFCDYRSNGINPPEWTPTQPYLLEVDIDTKGVHGEISDTVHSYIGLRSAASSKSFVLLNGRPFYIRGVIHSGLYEGGLPYPLQRSGYFRDAMAAKNLGFNTIRYDSRIENPAAYFCADAVGLTVWQDFPGMRAVSENDVTESVTILNGILDLLQNFPSVVFYALFNENKGLPGPFFRRRLIRRLNFFYSYLKTKDSSRLVIDNSGFYHHLTDIFDLHCLTGNTATLKKYLEAVGRREVAEFGSVSFPRRFFARLRSRTPLACLSDSEVPAPIVLSETGGIAIDIHPDEQTLRFLTEMFGLFSTFPFIKGFCFRQFADTPVSSSGILKEDRLIKGSTEMWKSLISR